MNSVFKFSLLCGTLSLIACSGGSSGHSASGGIIPQAAPAVAATASSSARIQTFVPAADGLTYERTCDRYPTAAHAGEPTYHSVISWVVRPYRVINGVQTYSNNITSQPAAGPPLDPGVFSNDAQGNVVLWGYISGAQFNAVNSFLALPVNPNIGAAYSFLSPTGETIRLKFDEQEPFTTLLGTFPHVYHFLATDASAAGITTDEYYVRGLGEIASTSSDGTSCMITATNITYSDNSFIQ